MSLYERLDFTRPNRRKLKSVPESKHPIWSRIDLTRPVTTSAYMRLKPLSCVLRRRGVARQT